MRRRTKQDRLIDTIDLYCQVHDVKEWTNLEVANWAIEVGLDDVPSIRSDRVECDVWDQKFFELKARFEANER